MGIDIILLCCVSCAYNVYKYMSVYIWVVFIYITGFKSSSDCDNLSRVVINPPKQKKLSFYPLQWSSVDLPGGASDVYPYYSSTILIYNYIE